MNAESARQPLIAAVENRDGRPRLMINGTEQVPLIYGLTDSPGSRWTWEEMPARNISVFASNGVRLFLADIWFEQMIGEDDQLDITLARKQVAGVLEQCPEAAVMLRLHVNAPQWWLDRHPDALVGYADTEPEPEHPWTVARDVRVLAQVAGSNGRRVTCKRSPGSYPRAQRVVRYLAFRSPMGCMGNGTNTVSSCTIRIREWLRRWLFRSG